MGKPVRTNLMFSPTPILTLRDTQANLDVLSRHLKDHFFEHGTVLNDQVVVRDTWLKLLDAAYTVLPSDRVLLVFPSSNRTITLPDPDSSPPLDPYPLTVVHAGSSNTVTLDPVGSITIDGGTSLALSAGERATVVPVSTARYETNGSVGAVGWYTIST